jgi:hypothetical protein
VMELDIHLVQRLLHMLDMRTGIRHVEIISLHDLRL